MSDSRHRRRDHMISTLTREGFRPRARRLLGRLAAVLVVGAIALGGSSVASADEVDTPQPTDPVVRLHVSAGGGTTTPQGAPVLSTVTLQNNTNARLSAGNLSLEINTEPLPNGAALDAWLDDGTAEGTFTAVAADPTPVVESSTQTSIGIVASAVDLGDLGPGVYPVRARLSGASTAQSNGAAREWNLAATTVLVIAEPGERATGVLVPITATPSNGALLTAEELATLTADGGALTGMLDAVSGTTAILGVDPSIPAAIRMLGSAAPTSAADWLGRLERLPNDVFALQFGDADATVQAHAGLPSLLTSRDLTPLLQPSDFPTAPPTPTATATATPTPSPTAAEADVLPGNEDLGALKGAHPNILWPRPDLAIADLQTFDVYLGGPATTIVSSTSVAGPASGHAAADGHDLLVTDTPASARLSTAVTLKDPAALDRELAGAAGHVFFAAQHSATVLLALDRSETRSPVAVRAAVTAFASPTMTLTRLQAEPPSPVSLAPLESAQPRASALATMLSDEQQVEAFSTILDEPALLLAPDRIRMLRTIGAGLEDAEFDTAAAALAKRTRTTLGSVSIQQPKPVQLFTSAAPLPVWIRNDLPWTVNVQLHSRPSDIRLDIQPLTQVTALADSSTRVDVPVEARVASGDVQVHFRLSSPADVPIGEPAVADVTLRADWEGIGLGILGGLIVVLFGLGVLRTVRRRRREHTTPGE